MDNGRRGARRVVTLVGVAVVAALIWVALTTLWLWYNQERVVFQPPSMTAEAPAPARRVQYVAADGHAVFGYLIEPATKASSVAPVVIAFHGNADLAAWLVPWA